MIQSGKHREVKRRNVAVVMVKEKTCFEIKFATITKSLK